MIVLSKEDRLKFAGYLRQEAMSNDQLATQANTMSGLDEIVRQYRAKAAAAILIAKDLEQIEDFSL